MIPSHYNSTLVHGSNLMKRLFLTLACCVSLLVAAPAVAKDGNKPDLVIRIVNVQEVMAKSTAVNGLRDQLNEYRKKYDTEFVKKENELQKEDRELVKQKTLLTNDVYRERVKTFRGKFADFQKELKLRQQQLDAAYTFALSKVSHQIKKIWLDVAAKEQATLVLPSADVLMFSPDYDVTDEVIVRLNKALPSVKFPDPETFGTSAQPKN